MINREKLRSALILSESVRLRPYRDSVGKLTIGVGRNIEDVGLTYTEVMLMLEHDIDLLLENVQKIFGFNTLNEVRKRVLLEMGFNLGITGLKKFQKMWEAIIIQDWEQAADEMLNSLWAMQVGQRAIRLATMMRTGEEVHYSK